MRENEKKQMVVSGVRGNVARITLLDLDRRTRQGATDEDLMTIGRSSGDADAVLVPMTDAGYADACQRLGTTPCHPTLTSYPRPRG